LKQADEQLEVVAELINEVKKRKDIVEKYVQGKGSINVMYCELNRHGLNKKINRGKQILKKTTGISDEVSDQLYNAILERFEHFFEKIGTIEKTIQNWTRSVKEFIDNDITFVALLEEFYHGESSSNPTAQQFRALIKRYRQDRDRIMSGPYADMVSYD
jgi:hypothetical protein